jgi:nucleoside-diphosphate-sugar epimerase
MTGATGYIGGAVTTELRRHGHGSLHSFVLLPKPRHLRDLEVVVHAGDLESPECLARTVSMAASSVTRTLSAVRFTGLTCIRERAVSVYSREGDQRKPAENVG